MEVGMSIVINLDVMMAKRKKGICNRYCNSFFWISSNSYILKCIVVYRVVTRIGMESWI